MAVARSGGAQSRDVARERIRCQGTSGNDNNRGLVFFNLGEFFAANFDQRLAGNCICHFPGKFRSIHSQSVASGNGGFTRNLQQTRARSPHFFFQQPRRSIFTVRLQRIGADQFGKIGCLVGGSRARGPHFKQFDGDATSRTLPRRFRSCEARANNLYSLQESFSANLWRSFPVKRTSRHSSRNSPPSALYISMAFWFQFNTDNLMKLRSSRCAILATRAKSALPIPRPRKSGRTKRSSR